MVLNTILFADATSFLSTIVVRQSNTARCTINKGAPNNKRYQDYIKNNNLPIIQKWVLHWEFKTFV